MILLDTNVVIYAADSRSDFFIGAHASLMSWSLATADVGRYSTYFPDVRLISP